MLLNIKLYGGLTCNNTSLESYGLNKFQLEKPQGTTLNDIHKLLNLKPLSNFVSIVNGHAQSSEYILNEDCNISIFPPMTDR